MEDMIYFPLEKKIESMIIKECNVTIFLLRNSCHFSTKITPHIYVDIRELESPPETRPLLFVLNAPIGVLCSNAVLQLF